MLDATNLGCVRGDRRIFQNVSFSLPPGTLLQLTGANGSGKTSLLRIISGLLTPAEGELRWKGTNTRSLVEEYYEELIYIGHRNGIKDELTSVENLRISSGLAGRSLTEQQARAGLKKMGLGNRGDVPVRYLSEGQRRRAALARLVTLARPLWVLDEVLTSLDKAASKLISSLIEEHLKEGGIAIVATHQELNITTDSFQRLELA